jgi:hypothetical protein
MGDVKERRRYHIVLGAILFSIVVWISVNMRNEFTAEMQMPVVIENLRAGSALRYPIPKQMTVRFRGSGWLIAGLSLFPDIRYYIDASHLTLRKFTITGRDLMEHVKLPLSVQLVDVKPETLLLALDEYTEKKVPIILRAGLAFHENYGQIGPVHLAPESVLIAGSRNQLESIDAWPTVYRKYNDLRSSLREDIDLEESGIYSVEALEHAAHLSVDVQQFAEKIIPNLPITAVDVPANREVIFLPPKLDLTVRGGVDQLGGLGSGEFTATVRFDQLSEDSSATVEPLVGAPGDVRVIGRRPERVQFIIRKRL